MCGFLVTPLFKILRTGLDLTLLKTLKGRSLNAFVAGIAKVTFSIAHAPKIH